MQIQQTQSVPLGQQPSSIVTVQPGNDDKVYNYASRTSIALGIAQVVCGGICIIFQFVAILIKAAAMEGGAGIWCGILFVIAGGLSIASGKQKTKCMIIGAMVTSILSAVFCLSLLTISAVGIAADHNYGYGRGYDYDPWTQQFIHISVEQNTYGNQVMYSTGSGGVTTGQLPNGQQVIVLNSNGQQQPIMQQQTGPVVMQAPYQGNMVMMPVSSLQTQQNISHQGQPFVQQNMGMIQQQTQPVIVQAPQYQQQQMPSPPPQYAQGINTQIMGNDNQAINTADEKKEAL